jgi:hypothetical protein
MKYFIHLNIFKFAIVSTDSLKFLYWMGCKYIYQAGGGEAAGGRSVSQWGEDALTLSSPWMRSDVFAAQSFFAYTANQICV